MADVATEAPAPGTRIRLAARPRALDGSAWGVRAPLLMCTLQLPERLPAAAALLEVADAWIVDPHPPAPQGLPAEPVAALLEALHRVTAALQREQNMAVFGRCAVLRDNDVPGQAVLVLPCVDAQVAGAALRWALGVADALIDGDAATIVADPGWAARLASLRERLRGRARGGTNSIHFLAAAEQLGLDVTALAPGKYRIGHGRGSRWLNSTITDATPSLSVALARRKDECAAMLRSAGLPVPDHHLAANEAAAVAAAQALGWPVVVKPADQDQGRGVFCRLVTEQQVRRSWRAAREASPQVLVEAFHAGEDYRLTVVHGRVVKIMHRRAGAVLGDGSRSVAALVAEVQAGVQQQRAFRRSGQHRLALDSEAEELLAEQGLAADAVPAAGRHVLLRRKANISTGGTHRALGLHEAHADNLAMAVRAAALLRLDMAGIDLISPDIGVAWHANGGVICEVNSQPQLGYRDTPQLFIDVLREMMAGTAAVPLHALLVDRGTQRAPLSDELPGLAAHLGCNAWSDSSGAWLAGRQLAWRPAHSVAAARTLLMEGELQSALFVLDAADVVAHGLPVARLVSLSSLVLSPGPSPGHEPGQARLDAPSAALAHALRLARPHAARQRLLKIEGLRGAT